METKGECGAEIRQRKPDNRNSETQEWVSWNSSLRLKRRSRARVTLDTRESCEMQEMLTTRSRRFGARVNRPNPTKKNGPARIKARAVGSKLARTNLDLGRARWLRGNADWMNGNANCLSDRNTFFICDTDERGLGLEENLRLTSLNFAYSRLSSLNGRKMFEARL